jgi:cellulose synthase/poly-beta-1,6-N-acetylglucosamine synthase-like glycosyltransferase
MKKQSISVGISAYNEAKTIRQILEGIISQKWSTYTIREILIFCDGCTDETAQIARAVNDKRIRVFDDGKRIGKTQRLNQMFAIFTGGLLVMFDADIRITETNVIERLIAPFTDPRVMLIGGNSRPNPPQTFVEKAVYCTYEIFYRSRIEIRGGNNIFGCTGSIWAVRGTFAKQHTFPDIICEDAYLYLLCRKLGYEFIYVDNAVIYYKLPQNFRDYFRQMIRSNPGAVDSELSTYFGTFATKELARPTGFMLKNTLIQLGKNPVGTTIVIILNLFGKITNFFIWKIYRLDWFTAPSTHI